VSQFLPSINAYLRVGLSAKEQRTGLLYLPGLLQEGDFFKVGKSNLASAVSTLTKSGAGPALRLNVDSGPPLAVNSNGKVANLNADKLDGLDSSALRTRCPAGTQSLGGGCIENTVRGTDRLSDASSTCAGLGRRLPTAASPSAAANT
jgi:hypothetical protein